MEEMRKENKQQSNKIDSLIMKTSNLEGELNNLKKDVYDIHDKMRSQEENIHDNEVSRLQTAIMDFAASLRNGNYATLNSFNYIFHAYDKYKSLGGNSFVDSEMEYIRKKKTEFHFTTQDS